MSSRINKEKTRQTIALLLDKVRAEADPLLLNEYRALFKKEISLFRRSWVSAYLLMLFDQGVPERINTGRSRATERRDREVSDAANGDASRRFPPVPALPEGESKRLFISVGRNRRVFPREILGLINSKTGLPREAVGSIRILDNYSFVQVRDSAAEQIIEALNGYTFRGRILAVNYAKSRKDGGVEPAETFAVEPATAAGAAEDSAPLYYRPLETEAPGADVSKQGQDYQDKEDI